ncbi:MAG: TIR domain-containing protein [Planctomycetes bacterium]|nr:TIR domain-containing protein [Planctomycetota bacterium]
MLVVLVDDEMVLHREEWEGWLNAALDAFEAAPKKRRVFFCALTRNFRNLGRRYASAQAIRLDGGAGDIGAISLELCCRLSNEICRLIDSTRANEESTTLFISHAKRDGREAARTIKRFIDNSPDAEVFFDEVSLQPSRQFEDSFREKISTATLVVLLTDTWASRYWCQWEALRAKELSRPILIVDMLSNGERRHFPYLGNVPVIRVDVESLDDDACRRIVSVAQIETLRDLHEHMRLEALAKAGRLPKGARHLTRAPELATLVTTVDATSSDTFIYPDPPIALHEFALISRFCAELKLSTPIEQLGTDSNGVAPLSSTVVAVSISDSEDLPTLGFEKAHLERLWVMLSRHILALGGGLAYGGDLRSGGFTDILFELVRAYTDEERNLEESIIHWFLAWPIHLKLSAEDVASLPPVIKLHKSSQPQDVDCDPRIFVSPTDNPYAWIRCLSEMRKDMVTNSGARVLVGGQRRASTPRSGILEEFLCSLDAGQPVFLCGGFGGMTADIITVLRAGRVPASFTTVFHADSPDRKRALDEFNESPMGEVDPIDYPRVFARLSTSGLACLNNGLDDAENERLFESQSVEEIVGLIRNGLLKTFAG